MEMEKGISRKKQLLIFFDEHKRRLVFLAAGLILLIFSLFLDRFFVEFFAAHQSEFVTYYMSQLTNFIFVFILFLVMTSILLYKDDRIDWIFTSWIAFAVTSVVVVLLKLLVARERPIDTYDISLFMYAFPSLHSATVFTLVPIFDREYPHLAWFWIGFAVVVAVSRLYLGAHYLSDVIAGAVIGYAIACGIIYVKRRYFYYLKW